ncbi:MAG: C25 family peptidase C-terminal domain-containing protein [Bacteroidales bacterium]
MNVTHNPILYAGVTSFDVTVDAGAFIALTVNGEIIGTAESTGGSTPLPFPDRFRLT